MRRYDKKNFLKCFFKRTKIIVLTRDITSVPIFRGNLSTTTLGIEINKINVKASNDEETWTRTVIIGSIENQSFRNSDGMVDNEKSEQVIQL